LYRGSNQLTLSVRNLEGKIASPSHSDEKVQTSTEIISTVFPYRITATAMGASVNPEPTLSIYTKSPQKPISMEPPTTSSRRMLVARLTIETMKFTMELANSSSEIFKELAGELELLLNDVFEGISGFLFVEVTSFEKGSIVCNFMIHIKMESSTTAEDFERILTAAAKGGKTGKYQISNIHVQDTDTVVAVKEKEAEGKSIPVKVIGVATFVGVAVLIIVFVFYKVSERKF